MKLNHLNLIVTNVEEAIAFFEKHFGFTCVAIKGDNVIAVLKAVDDFTLVLMAANTKHEIAETYPQAFHIGFMMANETQVNETYLKLKNSGIAIESEPKKIRDGFGFYFHFDNIMIEVAHPLG